MIRILTAAFAALLAIGGPAAAQDYPTRPVTMVIPFAAGGPTDVLGRVVAARMSEILGQQIMIENIGGAGGMTGANRVKTAAARRLPDPARHGRHAGAGAEPVQEAALRCRQGLPAGRAARRGAAGADRAQGPAGQQHQGVRRVHQEEPGQDAVRLLRRRRGGASRHRAVELVDRRERHPCPLSRQRAGDAGPARRARRLHDGDRLHRVSADPGQCREGDRGARAAALKNPARPADRARGRRQCRRLYLERDLPAERHAGADRQEAATTRPSRR